MTRRRKWLTRALSLQNLLDESQAQKADEITSDIIDCWKRSCRDNWADMLATDQGRETVCVFECLKLCLSLSLRLRDRERMGRDARDRPR